MHSGCPKLAFNLGSELLVGKVTLGFLLCRKENKLLLGVRGFLNISACAWADHPALVERWEAKPGKWLCPSFLFPQQSSFSAVSVVEVEKCYSWLSLHSGQLSRRGRFQQWKYDKSFPFMWGDLSPFHTPPQKCSERRVGVPKSFFVHDLVDAGGEGHVCLLSQRCTWKGGLVQREFMVPCVTEAGWCNMTLPFRLPRKWQEFFQTGADFSQHTDTQTLKRL